MLKTFLKSMCVGYAIVAGLGAVCKTAEGATRRLNVPLVWEDLPRGDNIAVYRKAKVPHATVTYRQDQTGMYEYQIGFDNGFWCHSAAPKGQSLVLNCGIDDSGQYHLFRDGTKGNAALDWVFDDVPTTQKGEELR